MSVISLTPSCFDYVKIETWPSRSYMSSSAGMTGSVYLYPERSDDVRDAYFSNDELAADKKVGESQHFNFIELIEQLTEEKLADVVGTVDPGNPNVLSIAPVVNTYMSATEDLFFDRAAGAGAYTLPGTKKPPHGKIFRRIDIKRGRPTPGLTTGSMVKNLMKNVLFKSYAHETANPNWAYTNYNCLKFMTGSKIPDGAVLIYPAMTRSFTVTGDLDDAWSIAEAQHFGPTTLPSFDGIDHSAHPNKLFIGQKMRHRCVTYTPFIPNPKLGIFARSYAQATSPLIEGISKVPTQLPPMIQPYKTQTQFTFEFWIKPNIKDLGADGDFRAGTVMHVSSSYAISLVTGSLKDAAGQPEGFRMMLAVSHSAEVPPVQLALDAPNNSDWPDHTVSGYTGDRSYPNDLVFLSSDNSLKFNHWHHVAIRWGSDCVNDGTGDFVIDGKVDSTFLIASGTCFVSPDLDPGYLHDGTKLTGQDSGYLWDFSVPGQNYRAQFGRDSVSCTPIGRIREQPNALFIGNFYEGKNSPVDNSEIARFFNDVAATNEGVEAESAATWYTGTAKDSDPQNVQFRYPLQAEIHELRIWQTYRTHGDIVAGISQGIPDPIRTADYDTDYGKANLTIQTIASKDPSTDLVTQFYAHAAHGSTTYPAYEKTGVISRRDIHHLSDMLFYLPVLFTKYSGPRRKVLRTPTQVTGRGHTWDPFNVELSLRCNITEINTNNFLRDFVTGEYPRQLFCTASGFFDMGEILSDDEVLNVAKTHHQHAYMDGYGNGGTYYPKWETDSEDDGKMYQGVTVMGRDLTKVPAIGSTPEAGASLARTMLRRQSGLRRNLLVMPCDNGMFRPDWFLLMSGTGEVSSPNGYIGEGGNKDYNALQHNIAFQGDTVLEPLSGSHLDKFTNDSHTLDLSLISLKNIWKRGAESWQGTFTTAIDSIDDLGTDDNVDWEELTELVGPTPINLGRWLSTAGGGGRIDGDSDTASHLPAMVFLHEGPRLFPSASSNLVSWWDISNIYYGDRIRPGTLKLQGSVGARTLDEQHTPLMTGTFNMTLRDDGHGGMYRADAATSHAKWNNVGNVFYNEGLVLIKSPHIHDLGLADLEGYKVDFVGDRNVHVLEVMFEAPAGQFTSSSNPSWHQGRGMVASDHVNDENSSFVYITGLNFHDENFNIIARTNLAQAVIKREEDKLFFRVKIDF